MTATVHDSVLCCCVPCNTEKRKKDRLRKQGGHGLLGNQEKQGSERGKTAIRHCHHGRGKGGVGPSHTKLKCIYSNVDTLLNKRTELHYLHEHDQPDIVSLTEMLPKNVKFAVQLAELQVDGYNCFSNICDGNIHIGVVVYVKKHLCAQQFTQSESKKRQDSAESVWVEIPLRDGEKLLVAASYRSPNSSKENDTRLNQFIVEASQNRIHVLIVGNFNHPEVDLESYSSTVHQHKELYSCKQFEMLFCITM